MLFIPLSFFRAAHHKVLKDRTNYLIIIVLEELDEADLDEEMLLYMKTNTYLSLDNKWFWEKLLYALPQTPLAQLQVKLNSKTQKVTKQKKTKKIKCNSNYTPGPVSPTGRRIYATPSSCAVSHSKKYLVDHEMDRAPKSTASNLTDHSTQTMLPILHNGHVAVEMHTLERGAINNVASLTINMEIQEYESTNGLLPSCSRFSEEHPDADLALKLSKQNDMAVKNSTLHATDHAATTDDTSQSFMVCKL